MARSKSRSHHNIAHLQPPTNIPTKYQLPTPYSFRDIARTRFYIGQGHYGKVKGQTNTHQEQFTTKYVLLNMALHKCTGYMRKLSVLFEGCLNTEQTGLSSVIHPRQDIGSLTADSASFFFSAFH